MERTGRHLYEQHRENLLDQSLAETFPASDPVSIAQPGGDADTCASPRGAFAQPSFETSTARRMVEDGG